jgi:membrane-associated phospholipid phosphatase
VHPFYQQTPFKIATVVLIVLCVLREWRAGYFRSFPEYLKTIRPAFYLKWLAAALILTTAVIVALDPVLLEFAARRTPVISGLSEASSHLGKKMAPWLLIVSCYWIASLLRKNGARLAAFGCLLSSALTGLTVTLCKYAFMRARPDRGLGPFAFFNFDRLLQNDNHFLSFSSGDVAVVAGASAYLFYSVKNHFLRAGIALLPFLSALARAHGRRHWPSDGLFSIFLGLLAAFFIYQYARRFNRCPSCERETPC